jgi:hypothetical protein
MVSEPFEAVDSDGNRVTGTVEVFRARNGPFYDPAKPGLYQNPRYADAHFEYFNTRGACTIDPKALSEAMQKAFANALEKFGISNPNSSTIASDVDASIEATRQQCARNADKYVSNETFSSTNWATGKAVGDLTAKAYEAVPASDGGARTVVAREDSWPVNDVPALSKNNCADASVVIQRVVTRDDNRRSAESSSPSTRGVGSTNPIQPVSW